MENSHTKMALQVDDKNDISELSESFGQTTTLHGIRGVLDSSHHKLQRIVWFVLVAAGLALYISLAYQSIAVYFNYETVTKVSTTTTDAMEFPAVTICDASTVPQSTMDTYNIAVAQCFLKGIVQDGLASNDTCAYVLGSETLADVLMNRRLKFFNEMFIMCSFNLVLFIIIIYYYYFVYYFCCINILKIWFNWV